MTTPVLPSPLPAVTERRPAQPAAFRPQPGPGYVAKYGPVRDDDVFWTNPDTGVRYHGNAELARANAISVFLELDHVVADLAEARRALERRRLAYTAGPNATEYGGLKAELEMLDPMR